ncbi:MAG TPA: helix-turn-helix domain-containing protein [Nitrospira sp.]|nr:helix-turn-helix domain-containing protein [Nitrospira sp.]
MNEGSAIRGVAAHTLASAELVSHSVQAVASTRGVSTATVRRWIQRGLKFCQPVPHGRILIRQDDLDAFLAPRQHPASVLMHSIEEVLKDLQNTAASKAATSDAASMKGTAHGNYP